MSSKDTASEECNATNFTIKNHPKEEQDGETMKPKNCNNLQERFNALTREKNMIQNENNKLRDRLNTVTEERDMLRRRQPCGRKITQLRDEDKHNTSQLFLIGDGTLDTGSVSP